MTGDEMKLLRLKTKLPRRILAIACLISLGVTHIASAADANAGADSYDAHCAECHSIAKPLKNKKGPGLFGITDRASASAAGYTNYSDAMKNANLKWTPDKLDTYITNSKEMIPGTTMKFKGISDAKERADLLEFLSRQK
jgi:cytochrome c